MDKINIDVLFPSDYKSKNHGIIDVYSLIQKDKQEEHMSNYVTDMIKQKNDKRLKLIDVYNKIFKSCIDKISDANKHNCLDIIYKVPISIFDCFEYNPKNCIQFLEPKLRQLYFDTCSFYNMANNNIINEIFITWKYLELNMARDKSNTFKNLHKKI